MPAPAKPDLPVHLWQQPLAGLLAMLDSRPDGLDEAEAAARLARVGPNLLHPRAERALLLEFLAHFRNPLVLVLLAASAIAGFLGDVRSFVIIGTIVLMLSGIAIVYLFAVYAMKRVFYRRWDARTMKAP